MSPVLKHQKPRSLSCTKLPPLDRDDVRGSSLSNSKSSTGSPALSSASKRSSSMTSTLSHSKSSSCTSSPELSASQKGRDQLFTKRSKRSLSSTQKPQDEFFRTSEDEFFPKLPNSLADSLFVSRNPRGERKVSSHKHASTTTRDQAVVLVDGIAKNLKPQKACKEAPSHKTPSSIAQDEATNLVQQKAPKEMPRSQTQALLLAFEMTKPPSIDQDEAANLKQEKAPKEAPSHKTPEDDIAEWRLAGKRHREEKKRKIAEDNAKIQEPQKASSTVDNTLALCQSVLDDHQTISSLANERNPVTSHRFEEDINNCDDVCMCLVDVSTTNAEQRLANAHDNHDGGTVGIRKERSSSLTLEESGLIPTPKTKAVPTLLSPEPADVGKTFAIEDNSTAPSSSRSIGMDENESVQISAIEALVSPLAPLRAVNLSPVKTSNMQTRNFDALVSPLAPPETRNFEALVSPLAPLRGVKTSKMQTRNLLRGQTVGLKGQVDAGISPNKLQAVTSTFQQYDEDSNGRLSVSEFHKLLKDQGIAIDIPDVQEAISKANPEGSYSLLASPSIKDSIDLAAFTELVAHGIRAESLREQQYHGYSKEEAEVLQGVFDAYDGNHTGVLEAAELGNLLQDIGQAPKTFAEQEELRSALESILGGSLRPLRFQDFLEFVKVLEKTSLGSGGSTTPQHRQQRRSSDRMEIARKAGLRMADVAGLEDIFAAERKNDGLLTCTEVYELLKTRMRLKAAEGEREQQVHSTIERHAGTTGSQKLDFEDFLVVVGDLVDAKLATVPSILGQEERSTNHFLGNLAAILE